MKLKNTLKIIFFSVLGLILISLVVILYLSNNPNGMTNTPLPKADNAYKIVHKYEMCAEALEKIYEDEVFEYYLPCMSSHAIYLEWNDGSTTLMIDDLKSGKVSIESLMNNGLKVYTEIK